MVDTCEWNPEQKRPKYDGEPCNNSIEWCVGADCKYQVCTSCARLPELKHLRKRTWNGDGPARKWADTEVDNV